MKSFLAGTLGAALTLIIFLAGAGWQANQHHLGKAMRYEMHVQEDGTIVRLDKMAGTLHMVTAVGDKAAIGDLPEKSIVSR